MKLICPNHGEVEGHFKFSGGAEYPFPPVTYICPRGCEWVLTERATQGTKEPE